LDPPLGDLTPALGKSDEVRLLLVIRRLSPWPVGVLLLADLCPLEDECLRSLRVGGRKEDRQRAAFRLAHQRGALGPDGIHDGPDVIHPRLERRCSRHAVAHAHPTLVEEDEPAEPREMLAEPAILRQLPRNLAMRPCAFYPHEIDVAVADDLVRHVDLAAAGEPDPWGRHRSRRRSCSKVERA
jgi:hypothetical protein